MNFSVSKSGKQLVFILFAKSILAFLLIISGWINLAPDEAQYWTWSQALDWGYYSKPPGIAWQIALTTFVFGNSEWGIRSGAVLIGFALVLAVYFLAKSVFFSKRAAFWAALIMAFSPLGFYFTFAATTDGGATLFLILATLALVRRLEKGFSPPYLLCGFLIGLGALYKWVAFVFWIFVLIFSLFSPTFRKKNLFLGMAISLLALLPSLYWNITHDFATFKHVANTIIAKEKQGNFIDFLGAQVALVSPIFFILLIGTYTKFKEFSTSMRFCALQTLAISGYLVLSFFQKIQPNWAVYLYPPGIALIGWFAYERHRIWLHIGLWTSILFSCGALLIPFVQAHDLFPISYKLNPFRQNMGWGHLGSSLEQAGYKPKEDFLFSSKYQTTSILSFYAPEQKRAYFFNINGIRKNQFSYFDQMESKERGKNGFFVLTENMNETRIAQIKERYLDILKPYFESIEYRGAYPLFYANGAAVKMALIFKCINYNGLEPEQSFMY